MDLENDYGMKAMHTALLKMLSDFNNICKEYNITYSLGFGSMLGAVREHGIIPWDDDIDIIIDRNNYRYLETILDSSDLFILERNIIKTLWIPRFRYRSKEKKNYGYELTIDIFVIDSVPNNRIMEKGKLLLVHLLQGMIKPHPNIIKGSIWLKVASVVTYFTGRLFPLSLKFKLLEKVSIIGNEGTEAFCSCYNAEYLYAGRKYDGCLLDDVIRVDFDGYQIPISKFYDSYLTTLYGDYMTPPKIKDRVPKYS